MLKRTAITVHCATAASFDAVAPSYALNQGEPVIVG